MRSTTLCLLAGCSVLCLSIPAAAADTLQIVHTFKNIAKGARPRAALTSDASGNLYGTTYTGGPDGNGAVFALMPPAAGKTNWTYAVLHRFGPNVKNGVLPDSAVIFDKDGNLYGTTSEGGINDAGTVFELAHPNAPGGKWTQIVLHRFTGGADGGAPHGTLVFGPDGALYGAAGYGGASGAGLIYRLSAKTSGKWKEDILYNFTAGADGGYPYCTPIFDNAGNLFGTTLNGGNAGNGVVFELSPPARGQKSWTETVLHSFDASDDGVSPRMGVIRDASGNLYGTTESGGSKGYGAVYEVSPPSGGGSWTENVIYSFGFSPDGGSPSYSSLVMDKTGHLYGTTQTGGTAHNGVVFALWPPKHGRVWKEGVLHTFQDTPDGAQPEAGLLLGADGTLFGDTLFGGAPTESGIVFSVSSKR